MSWKLRTRVNRAADTVGYQLAFHSSATVQLPAGHRCPSLPMTQNWQVVPAGMP